MSKIEQLQKLYIGVLEEDYKVWTDDDSDVIFKHPDMGTLFISLQEEDPEYFSLNYPNFLDNKQAAEHGVDEEALFRIVNDATRQCKVVKFGLRWDDSDNTWNVSVSVEAFLAAEDQLPSRDLIAATFGRYMGMIRTARQDLFERVRDHQQQDDGPKGTTH